MGAGLTQSPIGGNMTIKEAFEKLTATCSAGMKNPFFIMRNLHDAFADIAGKIEGGGSSVEVTQTVSSGTKIATIKVDDDSTDLYAPMHEYSTTEHVVGKWIDGSDLYERTFTFSFTCTSNDQTTIIETLASGIDVKIISEGYVLRDNSRFKSAIYPPNDIYYAFIVSNSDNTLNIRIGNSDESPISGNVTIQYTKSTD